MTIRQKYEEIIKRIKSDDNAEKYRCLYEENDKNKSLLLMYLKNLQEAHEVLEENKDMDKKIKDFWENTCKMWIKKIEKCLEKDNWK